MYDIIRSVSRGVAQFGRALDLGSRGRKFESCHPDAYSLKAHLKKMSFYFIVSHVYLWYICI